MNDPLCAIPENQTGYGYFLHFIKRILQKKWGKYDYSISKSIF